MDEFGKKLRRAMKFSYRRHKGQLRDGDPPLPYVTHPMDVLNILRYEGRVTHEDTLCAALLHDLLEETETTREEIEERCGPAVAALVQELTRIEPSDEVRAQLSEDEVWTLRNQMLLDEISKMGIDAQMVKLADRASNLRGALATRTGERLDRYLMQSRQILERIDRAVNPALWEAVNNLSRG